MHGWKHLSGSNHAGSSHNQIGCCLLSLYSTYLATADRVLGMPVVCAVPAVDCGVLHADGCHKGMPHTHYTYTSTFAAFHTTAHVLGCVYQSITSHAAQACCGCGYTCMCAYVHTWPPCSPHHSSMAGVVICCMLHTYWRVRLRATQHICYIAGG